MLRASKNTRQTLVFGKINMIPDQSFAFVQILGARYIYNIYEFKYTYARVACLFR